MRRNARAGGLEVVMDAHRHRGDRIEAVERVLVLAPVAGVATPLAKRGEDVVAVLRTDENAQPAIGNLAGKSQVARADGGEVDRQVCPGTGLSTSSRFSAARTMARYSRVRASGASKPTPCQPSLTCGPETPRPRSIRPPENQSRVAAVIAVIAGVLPGIWKTAEPSPICCVLAPSQPRTVAASEP